MMRLFKKKTSPIQTMVGTQNDAVREAWVESQLALIEPGKRILDAGAGEHRFQKACDHLEYVSQDFGEYEPQDGQAGLHVEGWKYGKLDHVCDISDIPEPDESFDAILCTEVLEHLPNPHLAIKEFSRLIRPGGKLLLSAPFVSLTHFAPYHFATGFNRYYYETLLPEAGFEIDEITHNGNFFELVAQELRRVPFAAEQFANSTVSDDEHAAMQKIFELLERLSNQDVESKNLACFGLHVVATRKPIGPEQSTSAENNAVSMN